MGHLIGTTCRVNDSNTNAASWGPVRPPSPLGLRTCLLVAVCMKASPVGARFVTQVRRMTVSEVAAVSFPVIEGPVESDLLARHMMSFGQALLGLIVYLIHLANDLYS